MSFSGDLGSEHFNALSERGQKAKSDQPRVAQRAKPDAPRAVAPAQGPFPDSGDRPIRSHISAMNPTGRQADGSREEGADGGSRYMKKKRGKRYQNSGQRCHAVPGTQQAAHPVANTPTEAFEPRIDSQMTPETRQFGHRLDGGTPGNANESIPDSMQVALRPDGETSGNGEVKPDTPSAAMDTAAWESW